MAHGNGSVGWLRVGSSGRGYRISTGASVGVESMDERIPELEGTDFYEAKANLFTDIETLHTFLHMTGDLFIAPRLELAGITIIAMEMTGVSDIEVLALEFLATNGAPIVGMPHNPTVH
jgi:hypothetical protein